MPADLILPALLTTELDAVNVLIASMGEAPVATITPSPSVDVDKALGALNEANRQVQSQGWKWNMEVAFPVSPDPVTGYILLPANALEVSAAYYIPQSIDGPIADPDPTGLPYDIVARGNQLYDRYNHTSVFTQGVNVYIDLTLLLEWVQVPEKARRVIVLEAVELFQSRDQMSSPTLTVNAKVKAKAWSNLEQGEDKQAGHNQLYDNIDTAGKLLGQGSMRRNRVNG